MAEPGSPAGPTPLVRLSAPLPPPSGVERTSISLSKLSSSSLSANRTPRINRKVESRREAFGLDATEVFMEDYLCAIKKRMLRQGRMYVFSKHVCFHANTFGHHDYYTIPFQEVTSITKEYNVGFPNSIKINWGGEHSLFFTSFVNREDAYKLLRHLWRKNNDRAPSPDEHDDELEASLEADFPLKKPVKRLLTSVGLRRPTSSSSSDSEDLSQPRSTSMPTVVNRIHSASDLEERDDDFEMLTDDQLSKSMDLNFLLGDGKPPPAEADAQRTVDFTLPCSTKTFWSRFLSNKSTFFKEFHLSRGDTDVQVTQWQKHSNEGMVRDMQFVTPLKMKMGPPTTLCCQSQQCIFYGGQHLVFKTSQTMNDIPYGDHFQVNSRWDVTPLGNDGCQVVIHTAIPFHKKTMWKSFIEKGVREGTTKSFLAWRDMAKRMLQGEPVRQKRRPGSTVSSPSATSVVLEIPKSQEQQNAPAAAPSGTSLAQLVTAGLGKLGGLSMSSILLVVLISVQLGIFMQLRQMGREVDLRRIEADRTAELLGALIAELRNGP